MSKNKNDFVQTQVQKQQHLVAEQRARNRRGPPVHISNPKSINPHRAPEPEADDLILRATRAALARNNIPTKSD
jgi:hypothetical protein